MTELTYEKLLRGWRAKLGPYTGAGRTKRAAQADLYALIASEPEIATPYVLRCATGDLWILTRVPGAWMYRTPTGCAVMLGGSRDEAINAMSDHCQQYYDASVMGG